jgi:hypothetical protein
MSDPDQHQACILGCRGSVPAELATEGLCILHFTLSLERACAEMRRETAAGKASAARQAEITNYLNASAVKLSHVATGSPRLSDDMKRRILATFLTLINLRENLDRAASRCVIEVRAPREAVASVLAVAPG